MIVEGIVEMGKQLGRTLGFPTANIRPERTVGDYPANGVYVAALWMQGDNRAYPCMLNQGVHPTVPEGKPTIEAHLLNFDGDLYGQRLRVIYLHFLDVYKRQLLKQQAGRRCSPVAVCVAARSDLYLFFPAWPDVRGFYIPHVCVAAQNNPGKDHYPVYYS